MTRLLIPGTPHRSFSNRWVPSRIPDIPFFDCIDTISEHGFTAGPGKYARSCSVSNRAEKPGAGDIRNNPAEKNFPVTVIGKIIEIIMACR